MATLTNTQKEAIGVRVVQQIVREPWGSGWQEYEARNDNAVDGICIMRRRGVETGGIVFVQIKCGGDGYRKDLQSYPDQIGVQLGADHVLAHRARWQNLPGPAVVVFIDDTLDSVLPPAWWADLKTHRTYSPTNAGMLLLPKSQRFGPHSKGDFHRLCGSSPADRLLPVIDTHSADLILPKAHESLHYVARGFYKE